VIDIETTGKNVSEDAMVEIASAGKSDVRIDGRCRTAGSRIERHVSAC
jgi:hypothetical protein